MNFFKKFDGYTYLPDSVALRALDGKDLGVFKLDDLCKYMDKLIEKKGRTE